jgi:hypothetical protein
VIVDVSRLALAAGSDDNYSPRAPASVSEGATNQGTSRSALIQISTFFRKTAYDRTIVGTLPSGADGRETCRASA